MTQKCVIIDIAGATIIVASMLMNGKDVRRLIKNTHTFCEVHSLPELQADDLLNGLVSKC